MCVCVYVCVCVVSTFHSQALAHVASAPGAQAAQQVALRVLCNLFRHVPLRQWAADGCGVQLDAYAGAVEASSASKVRACGTKHIHTHTHTHMTTLRACVWQDTGSCICLAGIQTRRRVC